jgi:hypothetical protein
MLGLLRRVESHPIASFLVCFVPFLVALTLLNVVVEHTGPETWQVPLTYRVRTYTPLGASVDNVYGKRSALIALARNGFSRRTDRDDWDLLWTLNPQTRYIVPKEHTVGGPLEPMLSQPRRPRICNNCHFFLVAGQKCQFAAHLHAMRRALGDEAAMDCHLDVYRWRSTGDMTRFLPLFNAPERPVFVQKACTMSRGRGIDFVRRPEHRAVTLDDEMFPTANASFVFQRQIDRPMLLDGHKFHVRVYLLVTSYHPVRISLFNDGLVFTAARKIAGASPADRDALLSNRAVSGSQSDRLLSWFWKHVGADRSARMRSRLRRALVQLVALYVPLSSALQHLSSHDIYPFNFRVTSDIDAHVADTIVNKLGCFDLFGVDIMFDDADNPYILEINAGPSMDSPRLTPRHDSDQDVPPADAAFDANNAIKRRMLTDAMALARRFVEGARVAPTTPNDTALQPLLTFDTCVLNSTQTDFCALLRTFRDTHCAEMALELTTAECDAELQSLFATLYHHREHSLHRPAQHVPYFDWFPSSPSTASRNDGAVNGFKLVFPSFDVETQDDDMYNLWVTKNLAPFTSLDELLMKWTRHLRRGEA